MEEELQREDSLRVPQRNPMRPKSRTASVRLNERLDEMIEDMMREKGYHSLSHVVQQAIIEIHLKNFPPYTYQSKYKSAEERLREKEYNREQRQRAKEEEQESICLNELNGRVINTPTGERTCKYFTYVHKERYEQDLPLDMVTKELSKSQYSPDRKTVNRLQLEGKVNYELKN